MTNVFYNYTVTNRNNKYSSEPFRTGGCEEKDYRKVLKTLIEKHLEGEDFKMEKLYLNENGYTVNSMLLACSYRRNDTA